MARVKGRDVVIDLMDAVAKLEATATKHADLFESMAAHAMATSAELTALSSRVNSVSAQMHGLSGQVNSLSGQVNSLSGQVKSLSGEMIEVTQRVSSLESEFHDLAESFVVGARLSRTMEEQLGRVGRLLGEFAGGSKTRFERIEGRLDRLEKKTG